MEIILTEEQYEKMTKELIDELKEMESMRERIEDRIENITDKLHSLQKCKII